MSQCGPGVLCVKVKIWFNPPKQGKFTTADDAKSTLKGVTPVILKIAYDGGLIFWQDVGGG